MLEYKILSHFVDQMENEGVSCNLIRRSINQEFTNDINDKHRTKKFTLSEMEKAADKCLSHEWLKRTVLGTKYGSLRISRKGVGVVRSKQAAASRSCLKKVSDYIERHKGIFILISFVIALVYIYLKIKGMRN